MLALSALSAAFSAPQTPFDAYLERPEPDFAWRDTGVNITARPQRVRLQARLDSRAAAVTSMNDILKRTLRAARESRASST